MVKLTYADQIRLDPTVGGVPKTYVFRANSLFDPDYSFTGHQPLYYDQYSAIYKAYKVYGSKITITGANDYSDQANIMGNLVVCNVTLDPADESSYTEAIERRKAKYRQCQERRPFTLIHHYSAKKLHQIKDVKDAVELEGLTGNSGTGTNPGQEAYFVISAHPLYKGSDPYSACLNVKIEYIACFFQPRKISGS